MKIQKRLSNKWTKRYKA